MRIAIAMVQVPFITGGAEIHAEMLWDELRKRGHQAQIVTIPFKWYPAETLLNCMITGRMMDLTEVNGEKIDLVIAMKFPAYYTKHPNKVIWLLHQHRQAYELWGTKYSDLHTMPKGEAVREAIMKYDSLFLKEAKKIFTNAKNTSARLMKFNGIESTALYHPPRNSDKMHCKEYGNFIFYASRIDQMKRQRLLVEAARYVTTDVKFYIAGSGSKSELDYLHAQIKTHNLGDKVKLLGFISEEEKIDYYARCLGVYFGAYDEDYGYITLESFFSKKPVIVHEDSGGPLEFVRHGENGYILPTQPQKIAQAIDELYCDRQKAKELGENGFHLMQELHMDWDYVIESLIGGN